MPRRILLLRFAMAASLRSGIRSNTVAICRSKRECRQRARRSNQCSITGAAKFAALTIVDCVSRAYNVSKTHSKRVCSERRPPHEHGIPTTRSSRQPQNHNATDRRNGGTHAAPIISPDPFCSVKLGAVSDLWFFQALPVIHNRSELAASTAGGRQLPFEQRRVPPAR